MSDLKISICTFANNDFEVILNDDDDREVVLKGKQKFTEEDLEFINEFVPPCIFTRYRKV